MAEEIGLDFHGRRSYADVSGPTEAPVVVLVHGIAGSAAEWDAVARRLAKKYRVIVPDLPGHGRSERLRGDHSLGAYAAWLRDVLESLDVERATFVGHSLGGGIVMQFTYQFPQYVERMALVSSGGLGREVTRLIRLAGLPGAEVVLRGAALATGPLQPLLTRTGRLGDHGEVLRRVAGFGDAGKREAFVRAVRAVTTQGGQRVSAADRLHLAAGLPVLIVWGAKDRVIPAAHGHAALEAIPGARLEIFDESGHFPHRDDPQRLAGLLTDFLRTTDPMPYDRERLREALRAESTDS